MYEVSEMGIFLVPVFINAFLFSLLAWQPASQKSVKWLHTDDNIVWAPPPPKCPSGDYLNGSCSSKFVAFVECRGCHRIDTCAFFAPGVLGRGLFIARYNFV